MLGYITALTFVLNIHLENAYFPVFKSSKKPNFLSYQKQNITLTCILFLLLYPFSKIVFGYYVGTNMQENEFFLKPPK